MYENCLIVQSGGPTAVINNSVVGLVDEMNYSGFKGKIYGSIGGIHGLIHEKFIDLSTLSIDDRHRLRWTPGAALGTCRHKITEEEIERIIKIFAKRRIRYFFYIGGNGSMQVAKMIDDIAKKSGFNLTVIGIPKSIDNDLLETDHSPGYGSAAKFLATSVLDMKMDVASYPSSNRVTIIETMGRHTGWLAAACALATCETEENQTLIYIPESPFHLESCLEKIVDAYKDNRNTFLIVAEGIKNKSGQYINGAQIELDHLDRPKLGGVAAYLNNTIEASTGIKTRSISTSIWQRSSILLASKTDVNEAYEISKEAWQHAVNGYSGVMIGMDREENPNNEYKITYRPKPLINVANKEKYFPLAWYDINKNMITNDFIHYVEPLIQGEMIIPMEKGLPTYKLVI